MDPLVSEVTISEPEMEVEARAKAGPTSTTEESSVVFTSELETPQAMEVAPAPIDHSLLPEPESLDVKNTVSEPEAMELQSELEPKAIETESMSYPVKDKTDDALGKTSDSAPVLATAQQLHEVAVQEIFQPQSNVVPVAKDDGEIQAEVIPSSAKLEEFSTAEHIEAKDTVVQEVNLTYFFAKMLLTRPKGKTRPRFYP